MSVNTSRRKEELVDLEGWIEASALMSVDMIRRLGVEAITGESRFLMKVLSDSELSSYSGTRLAGYLTLWIDAVVEQIEP